MQEAGREDWTLLMTAAQDGDRAAYRRLLTEVTPVVRALARRLLRDPAEVEDAVQDILLTLHAMRHVYDPERPFTPWLLAIARHRVVDRLRVQRRRATREVAMSPEHETTVDDRTNGDAVELDGAALRRAMASLPEGQRTAVELLKLREMSLQEAASATGMTVGALKVSMHRALLRLRGLLGEGA